jgi:putative transposase
MPRAIRVQDAGYLHHIVSKGNNSQSLFKDDSDYKFYLNLLENARKNFPVQIYNYVLLNNTIHLTIEPLQQGNLSKFMEMVSKNYARYFNKKYNQTGHVFQGRFKSFLLQSEKYFFTSCNYINSVTQKAALEAGQKSYKWSAFSYLAHGKSSDIKIDLHELYTNLGGNDYERQIVFKALIKNYQGETIDFLNRRADVLGDRDFKNEVKKK